MDTINKDDTVSRQEAIDAVERAKTAMTTADREIYCAKINAQMNIQLLPTVQPEQPSEIQDILNYLDTVLHPIISPEHWSVYSELYDMVSMLPAAQPEQRWIPVTERLPKDEYVLISKKPTKLSGSKWCVGIGIRIADPRSGKIQWRDSGFGVIQDDKVLAWMPLPEPYGGEQE